LFAPRWELFIIYVHLVVFLILLSDAKDDILAALGGTWWGRSLFVLELELVPVISGLLLFF
jgi:hypothetical protein